MSFLPIIIYKVLKRFKIDTWLESSFLPIIIYKVLKLKDQREQQRERFLTHHNLQGSQTPPRLLVCPLCFLPIIIYKVLKPQICIFVITEPTCLTTAKL